MMTEQQSPRHARRPSSIPWGLVIGIIIGGGAGYLVYVLIGCGTGTCPITSNPFASVLYGSVMGGLVSRM